MVKFINKEIKRIIINATKWQSVGHINVITDCWTKHKQVIIDLSGNALTMVEDSFSKSLRLLISNRSGAGCTKGV